VVMIRDLERGDVLPYLRALRAQMHLGLPKVTAVRGASITIRSEHPRSIHSDDQVIGMTPQTIRVEPGVLKVLPDERV